MDWLSIREALIDTFKFIAVVAVILVLMIYVVSIAQVMGSSMYPTLKDGEILILDKLHYHLFEVKRGDIISLDYADTKYLIKRVIGLPGDVIEIIDNQLYINGNLYEEAYIDDSLVYDDFSLLDLGYQEVPANMYFVMGDNRCNGCSLDSREIGFIPKEDINGKIVFRFWPINKISLF